MMLTPAPIALAGMPPEMHRLYMLLQGRVGKHSAIGMADLYERWSGEQLPRDARGKIVADVPTFSRRMRQLIDDLRDIHGIPIMSSARHGYWIVATEEELRDVIHEFRARGLKSLSTAARLRKISLAEELQQIDLDLRRAQ